MRAAASYNYSFSESYLYIPDVSKTFSKPLRILNETLNDGWRHN